MRRMLAAFVFAGVASGSASATTVLNSNALLTAGSTSISQTNIGGRVEVGGDFTSTGTSNIGGNLTAGANGTTVVGVAGNLDYPSSTVAYGNVVYGGTNNTDSYNRSATPNGTTAQGTVNVAGDFSQAVAISNYLAQQASTGTLANQWGSGTLSGTSSGVNIYNISVGDLSSLYQLTITGGTSAIVNVTGGSIDSYLTFSSSLSADNILFNFVDATSVHFYSNSLGASIVAANAAVKVDNTVQGSVIGASLTAGGATIGGNGYNGSLAGYSLGTSSVSQVSAVPEPASWLILITGFGLVGWTIRRGSGLPWLAKH